MSDVRSCTPGESKPAPYSTPAEAPEPKEPTCDMCVAKGDKGRIEAIRGNGDTAYVCDTCGWLQEVIPDSEWDEDDGLHCEQAGMFFVNVGEAFKYR